MAILALLTRLDKLTLDFILAVILTDCLICFFVWYEVFYNDGDSRLATTIGIFIGVSISLAVTIVTFAHWEGARMISERYKRLRFEAGLEKGKEKERERFKERVNRILEEMGDELSPELKERLLGISSDEDSNN